MNSSSTLRTFLTGAMLFISLPARSSAVFDQTVAYNPPSGYTATQLSPDLRGINIAGPGVKYTSPNGDASVSLQLVAIYCDRHSGTSRFFTYGFGGMDVGTALSTGYILEQLPALHPTTGKINGADVASATIMPSGGNHQFFHACWMDIETNFVLKVTISASDVQAFNQLTNSIRSIRVNKNALLAVLLPPNAANGGRVGRTRAVDIGYMNYNSRPIAAVAFHLESETIFLKIQRGPDPLETIDQIEKAVASATNAPSSGALRLEAHHDTKSGIIVYRSFAFVGAHREAVRPNPRNPTFTRDSETRFFTFDAPWAFAPAGFYRIFHDTNPVDYVIREDVAEDILNRFISL